MAQEFSKEWFKSLSVDIAAALKETGVKYGLDFRPGNISYNPGISFSMKLEGTKTATDDFDPKQADWDRYAPLFGLKAEHLGAKVSINGVDYVIDGIRPRGKSKMFLIRAKDGTVYNADLYSIKLALGLISSEEDAQQKKRSWDMTAFMVGLKGVPYGQRFAYGKDTYEAVEIAHSSKAYPIIARRVSTGKLRKFPATVLEPYKPKADN